MSGFIPIQINKVLKQYTGKLRAGISFIPIQINKVLKQEILIVGI